MTQRQIVEIKFLHGSVYVPLNVNTHIANKLQDLINTELEKGYELYNDVKLNHIEFDKNIYIVVGTQQMVKYKN